MRDSSNFVLRIFAFNFFFLASMHYSSKAVHVRREIVRSLSDLVALTYIIAESDFTSIT